MARNFTLDRAGVGNILKGPEVAAMVGKAAARVAAAAGPGAAERGAEVEVRSYTTDRAAAVVVILDGRSARREAVDGTLIRAAAAAGLEVTGDATYTTKAGKTRKASIAQINNWTRGSR